MCDRTPLVSHSASVSALLFASHFVGAYDVILVLSFISTKIKELNTSGHAKLVSPWGGVLS